MGLIVKNVVRMLIGENMSSEVKWVEIMGEGMVIEWDIVGRMIRFKYEIKIGKMMGVVGREILI